MRNKFVRFEDGSYEKIEGFDRFDVEEDSEGSGWLIKAYNFIEQCVVHKKIINRHASQEGAQKELDDIMDGE